MTATLEGGEWSAARHGRTLPPEKTRYPFYRRLGGPQGRSGWAENLVFTGIRSRTVVSVAQSLYRLSHPYHIYLFISLSWPTPFVSFPWMHKMYQTSNNVWCFTSVSFNILCVLLLVIKSVVTFVKSHRETVEDTKCSDMWHRVGCYIAAADSEKSVPIFKAGLSKRSELFALRTESLGFTRGLEIYSKYSRRGAP